MGYFGYQVYKILPSFYKFFFRFLPSFQDFLSIKVLFSITLRSLSYFLYNTSNLTVFFSTTLLIYWHIVALLVFPLMAFYTVQKQKKWCCSTLFWSCWVDLNIGRTVRCTPTPKTIQTKRSWTSSRCNSAQWQYGRIILSPDTCLWPLWANENRSQKCQMNTNNRIQAGPLQSVSWLEQISEMPNEHQQQDPGPLQGVSVI